MSPCSCFCGFGRTKNSMRIFEWISLLFLVTLLKFATDSTREIYVRLTSPCPSPMRPSSPISSPIGSPGLISTAENIPSRGDKMLHAHVKTRIPVCLLASPCFSKSSFASLEQSSFMLGNVLLRCQFADMPEKNNSSIVGVP